MRKWLNRILPSSKNGGSPLPDPRTSTGEDNDAGLQRHNSIETTAALKEEGDLHLRNGDFANAAQCFRALIAVDPNNTKVLNSLGFSLLQQGVHAEAEQQLRRVLELDSANADAHYLLGQIAQSRKEIDAAVLHYRQALTLAPDLEQAYADLSGLLMGLGQAGEATELILQGVGKNPDAVDLLFLLGNLYYSQQKFHLSIDTYRRVLSIDPQHCGALTNAGHGLSDIGEFAQAISCFENALAICPESIGAKLGLAKVADIQYRFDDAIFYFRGVLAHDASYPGVEASLAVVHAAKRAYDDFGMLHRASAADGVKKVRLVCATRETRNAFFTNTALGKSFLLYKWTHPGIELQLFAENATGLPVLYNRAIDYAEQDPACLIFIHDDVFLSDLYWLYQIKLALNQFDVVGLAGNTRRLPRQASWNFVDGDLVNDHPRYFSGMIGSGSGFPCKIVYSYGPPGQECKLLDGVFLAVDSATLATAGLRFDTRFDFHFYDMDFCRQAELKKLRMGTWPISVVHESMGLFGTPAWRAAYSDYLEKYGE